MQDRSTNDFINDVWKTARLRHSKARKAYQKALIDYCESEESYFEQKNNNNETAIEKIDIVENVVFVECNKLSFVKQECDNLELISQELGDIEFKELETLLAMPAPDLKAVIYKIALIKEYNLVSHLDYLKSDLSRIAGQ